MADNPFAIPLNLRSAISNLQRTTLIIGALFTALTLIGFFLDPTQFFRSWLTAFLLPFGFGFGSLALLMLQYLSGGAWGAVIRRPLEAATRTMPFVALLFVPLLFGMHNLYEWTDSQKVAKDLVFQHRQIYMNVPFFLLRQVLYFGIWIFWAWNLNRLSRIEENSPSVDASRRLMGWSGPGVVMYAITLTFAATDWVMTLDPHWFSTIYGFIFLAGHGLSVFSLMIITTVLLMRYEPMMHVITKKHLHDLGKFLFAFTMLWTYLSFSQFLIIWAGNLPEEITFLINRLNGGWQWIGLFVLFFQFVIPFLILLSQDLKRNPAKIMFMAVWVILVRAVDLYWYVEPNFHKAEFFIHWLDITAPIGLAGLWLSVYLWQLKARPLMAANAPDLDKALAHGRHH